MQRRKYKGTFIREAEMKGSIKVIVQNDRIKYEFLIRRNITIVKGDSATGKTSLIDMIREYNLQGAESGIELFCEKTVL